MLHLRARTLQSTATDELVGYKTLAANVLARATEDLADPDHAIGAASWLLTEAEASVWGAWLGLQPRIVRPTVLAAVERILGGQVGGKFRKRLPRPEHRAALAALLKRHGPC